MPSNFHLPPIGFGPGSQPPEKDGQELEYMQMPQDMRIYSSRVPDVKDNKNVQPALDLLTKVAEAATAAGETGKGFSFSLSDLDADSRNLIAETLGEGEVAIRIKGIPAVAAQESVFAGIWVLKGAGLDSVEIGPVPALALERAFATTEPALGALTPKPKGLVNAPAVLVELMDKSATWKVGEEIHVVNMSLLPHSEEDLKWLEEAFGKGSVTALSRGYGNCRVEATGQRNVWHVQFFNSMDTLILDTYEVTSMPEVALAAPEDLKDSGERLLEVIEAIR